MAIGDYTRPILVHGFECRNCSDVDKAKKDIDPAHPEDGPFGIYKRDDASRSDPAVTFGGALAHLAAPIPQASGSQDVGATPSATRAPTSGGRLDISV